jgi:hypothetical protein
MLRRLSAKLPAASFALAIILLPAGVLASTLDYTFSGVGSGTISGNTNTTFSDADFTVSFTENTSAITSPDTGYYEYAGIDGTFTEGSYTTTFTDDTIEVNGNPNTGMGSYETVFLFASDNSNSIGISENPALLGYTLATPVTTGVQTSNIGAFSDATGFSTTTGDSVQFTGLTSLDFTAAQPTSAVPEPSSLALLLIAGLGGIAVLRRRFVS